MIDVWRNVPGIGVCKCRVEEPDRYGAHPLDVSFRGECRRLPWATQLAVSICEMMQNQQAARVLVDNAMKKKIKWGVRCPIKHPSHLHRNPDTCDCRQCMGDRGYSVFWDDRGLFWDDLGWQPGDVKESIKWYVRKDGSIRREMMRETVGSDSPPSVTPVV